MDKASLKPGHLRRIKSLALMSDAQLAAFLEYVKLVDCPRPSTLFREGQRADSMYLILDGQMRVYTKQRNGEIIFLRMLEAGDAFGEVALLSKVARTASVEAVCDTTLVEISAAALDRLIADQPELAAQFLYHLARSLGRQLSDVTAKWRAFRDQASMFSSVQ